MTLQLTDIAFFAGSLVLLVLTPGPVWLALAARALAGGFHAAWPLAIGVTVGDAVWSALAILGMSWVLGQYGDALVWLKWIAGALFLIMGALVIRHANQGITTNARLTRPGVWAGFLAGLAVIIGNPKAILFYMGILPGFFDLSALTWADGVVICLLAALIPLIGNLTLALGVTRVRRVLSSDSALRRTNLIAGGLLMLVGALIPFL